jgi:hypothetical protein
VGDRPVNFWVRRYFILDKNPLADVISLLAAKWPAVVGSSGSGKSSVARAGLVAVLKHDAVSGSAHWPVAIFRPGLDPLESLAVALAKAADFLVDTFPGHRPQGWPLDAEEPGRNRAASSRIRSQWRRG